MSREVAHSLSPREAAILQLASEGFTDSAIANRLQISEGTVGTYWGRIRTKLGPYSRPELVAHAVRTELMKEIHALEDQRNSLRDELEQTSADERLFEEILDASDEGVLVMSSLGEIRHANPAVLAIFGYEKPQVVGKHLADLMPERFRASHRAHFAQFGTNPSNRRMNEHSDTFGLTSQGAEVPLYITISAVHRDGESLMTCFIRPGQV